MSILAPAPATNEVIPQVTAILLNLVRIAWTFAALLAVKYILRPLVHLDNSIFKWQQHR